MSRRLSKFTASVCALRRAVGSLRSKRDQRGSTAVIMLSPCALCRKRTKSPVIGITASLPRNALFFLRASISPSASLQTRW